MTNYPYAVPRGVATTATANATLAKGKHTPVDASSGALTMTLPTGATPGSVISVEKIDSSTNAVTVSGSIRGSASTLSLDWQFETIELIADSAGSWRPVAGHKTKAAILAAITAAQLVTRTQQTGTSYTFVLADAGTEVEGANAAATTFTVPTNASVAFPVGAVIAVRQFGAGQITIAAAGGVTLRSRGSALKTYGQYSMLNLTKRSTDEWLVDGDVTT